MEIVYALLVFGGTGVLVLVVVVLASRAAARRRQAGSELASRRGWTVEEKCEGSVVWRFKGGQAGMSWRMEGVQTRSNGQGSSRARYTRLIAQVPSGGEGVLLGPKLPAFLNEGVLSSGLVQAGIRAMVGEEASELLARAEKAGGFPGLGEYYDVLTTDRDLSRRFLTDRVQSALTEFAGQERTPPVITFWQDTLTLRVSVLLEKPSDVERLAAFGERLLEEAVGLVAVE